MTVPSINRVTIIGTICSPAEVKFISSGKALTTFRVRVDETFKDRSGAQQVRSSENPVTWWGEHTVTRGQLVYVEARLQSRSYESGGGTRYAVEVVADRVIPLGGAAAASDPAPARRAPAEPAQPRASAPEDEVPF